MYDEDMSGIKRREAFFKKHGIKCTCRPGYVVCGNCGDYYRLGGKLMMMKMKNFIKRAWPW